MKMSIKLGVFIFLFLAFLSSAYAQGFYIPYYGKNRVLYENFKWKSYATDHFRIYFYAEGDHVLKNVAEVAESAYQKIRQLLKHELAEPVPIIYYTTVTDFEQSNVFQVSEGVLGVAEPVLHRIGVHGDMPLDELQYLVEHELTHVFEFDILWGSPGRAIYAVNQPPLWIFEGLSEYTTQNWSSWSELILRDAVLNDRIPELTESGDLYSRHFFPRPIAYDFGHAIYEFLEHKYGRSSIMEFWQSMKNSPLIGKRDPIKKTFNMSHKEFNYEFKKFLRERYKDFLLRENPEDYSITLGPEFPVNPYFFSFSHAISPSGDIIAAITYNLKDYEADIVLISAKDGSIIKNITKGYTTRYEYIKYEIDFSKGKDIAWSPDGDTIVFFARDGQKHSLFLVDAFRGDTIKKIRIPFDQPSGPAFFPDGKALLFTAFERGVHDVFKVDLSSDESVNLTGDDLFEKAPAISPDAKYLAYSLRVDTYDKLFLSPLDNLKEKTQLTFGKGNTIAPHFSSDGKEIYFAGDMRGAFNIYSLNLESGELKRYSDVRTGNFFPVPHPTHPNKIFFSSFNKSSFQIFSAEMEGIPEKTILFADAEPQEEFRRFEPILTLDINKEKIEPYKGMGKLYLTSRPPIDAIVSTDGSIYGGSAISLSDIFGDHNFYAMAYQVQSFRSYYFAYLNLKKRFQYMASAFQYTLYYYPPYYYYDPSFYYYDYLTYRDAIATRKISGINLSGYYPFSRYYRAEAGLGLFHFEEDFLDPFTLRYLSGSSYGYFWNGNWLWASLSLVGETTQFKYFGPAAGNTFRLSVTQALPVSESFFSNTTVEADLRQYVNLGDDFLFAFRFEGFASRGKNPYVFYFGGNNQVRSAYYLNIIANEAWYANAEFRFPLISSMNTLLGQIGPVRGVFFFDISRSKIQGYPAKFYRYTDTSSFLPLEFDAIGSYGYGITFFFLGLPFHLEFVKRLEFPRITNPLDVQSYGKFETKFWIGFDF